MKTREQRRRSRRQVLTVVWIMVLLSLWCVMLLCTCASAACEIPGVRTDQAVTGTAVWTWALMKIILWLDKPTRRN